MKKLLIDFEVCFLIRSIVVTVFFMTPCLTADGQDASNKILSFDNVVVSCPYKKVIDASMRVWGYVQALRDIHTAEEDLSLVCDAIAGCMACVGKQMDALLDECQKGIILLTDDVVYLIDVFHYIDREYQAIARRRGTMVFVDMEPLYQVREKCLQLIAM